MPTKKITNPDNTTANNTTANPTAKTVKSSTPAQKSKATKTVSTEEKIAAERSAKKCWFARRVNLQIKSIDLDVVNDCGPDAFANAAKSMLCLLDSFKQDTAVRLIEIPLDGNGEHVQLAMYVLKRSEFCPDDDLDMETVFPISQLPALFKDQLFIDVRFNVMKEYGWYPLYKGSFADEILEQLTDAVKEIEEKTAPSLKRAAAHAAVGKNDADITDPDALIRIAFKHLEDGMSADVQIKDCETDILISSLADVILKAAEDDEDGDFDAVIPLAKAILKIVGHEVERDCGDDGNSEK